MMNPYETDTNGTLVNNAPLFASVWLALFYVLRKNFNERRLASAVSMSKPRPGGRRVNRHAIPEFNFQHNTFRLHNSVQYALKVSGFAERS